MKIRLLLSFIIMMMVGCVSGSQTPVRASSGLVKHIGASTVGLVMSKNNNIRVYCTGVFVSKTEIMTANHCVEALAREVKKIDEDSEEEVDSVGVKVHYIVEDEVRGVGVEPSAVHLGAVSAVDVEHDLALVEVELGGMPAHEVADVVKEMPGLGESAMVVGHPKGQYWSYVSVVISSYRAEFPIGKSGPFVQVSGNIWFGNSGGGLFDKSGDLVGICSSLGKSPQSSMFIHADSIKRFIKLAHEK